MRLRFVLLFFLLLAAAWFGAGERRRADALQTARRAYYEKSLQFSGFHLLSFAALRSYLPEQESVAWWMLNEGVIEAKLLGHPLIQRADVRRCEWWRWGCFAVEVQERQPGLVTQVGETRWIIGTDGAFLAPEGSDLGRLIRARGAEAQLPMLRGLPLESLSPEQAKAGLAHVQNAAEIVEDETKLKIAGIDVKSGGDMGVRFVGEGFVATLTLAGSGNSTSWGAELRQQAARLNQVLAELGEKKRDLREVDLAFNKIAVVKFRG